MPIRSEEAALDTVEERVSFAQLMRELDGALALLPAAQRQALELRVVEELPYAHVAASLRCSELAARLRVRRARNSLTRLLKGAAP
jgi:RNA polymerase sigma factor (sigma-70 family)